MGILGIDMEHLSAEQLLNVGYLLLISAGFVLSSFFSRRIWLWYGAVVVALRGLTCVLLPKAMILINSPLVENDLKVDGLHLHLVRCIGIVLVVNALTQYRLSDRDFDSTIFTSVVFTRLVVVSLVLVNYIYSYDQSKSPAGKSARAYRDLSVYLTIGSIVAQIFGGLIQLYRCPAWGGYPETLNRLNFHIRLDYLCIFICGLFTFAAPEKIISFETTLARADAIHLDEMRKLAILFIGSALLMGRCPGFLRDNDKVTLLESRILQNVLLLILAVYSHNKYSVFTVNHIYFGIVGILIWTLNAVVAYLDTKRYPKHHDA